MNTQQSESTFFDHSVATSARRPVWKYYAITKSSRARYDELVFTACAGKRVLEYGCGSGSYAVPMARRGALVTGIDISRRCIEAARREAAAAGFPDTEFIVMDAMDMDFPDESFDLVIGTGILHHLDLDRCFDELLRVLRPGGRAVFLEPLGHNPALNIFRRVTPQFRTNDEHPLTRADLKALRSRCGAADYGFFHVCSFFAIPFLPTRFFWPVLGFMDALDRRLFRLIPPLRWWSWYATLEFPKPAGEDA
jgi:SAM-dependent methyltransferase